MSQHQHQHRPAAEALTLADIFEQGTESGCPASGFSDVATAWVPHLLERGGKGRASAVP